ncbi:MAG TPA: lysophospholipid acyltransferase family protein [Flavisolibacter sp.]|jgi:1-acyl-sn-glycerol-3-phosphate acyltransferase|nr:lysophospholipid acyltransferase family protein [Flavisolibacter sp.]
MRILLKPLHYLYVIYAFLLFVILMIPVFLWALLVSRFGKIKGGNLLYRACTLWADIWFALIFIQHRNVYIEKPKAHQSYIFVANHISYLDSAVLPKAFRRPVRPLGKVEITKVPVFGTIYKTVIVTVDRSSAANRAKSVQIMKGVLQNEISVLVFPEGTFNMTGQPLKEFYDGAFRIAIETGTPIMPVLFLNTYDRMHYASIFSLNPGKSRSVFLPAISVEDLTAGDVATLKQQVYHVMEQGLRKYNVNWIKNQETH